MADRLEFQGYCLVNEAGKGLIGRYDKMPPHVRKRIRNSPFNICPACVGEKSCDFDGPDREIKAIEWMEDQIRRMECVEAA